MSSLKVTSPPEKLREYDGKHGQLVVWGFDVAGEGRVELHKKPDNAPPSVGSIVLGNVKEMEHAGQLFKRLYLDSPSPGGNSDGGKTYERQPDHPINTARALHTSAISTAPVLIEQMLTIGVVEQPKTKEEYLRLVAGVAAWVEQTYPAVVRERAASA